MFFLFLAIADNIVIIFSIYSIINNIFFYC